MTSTRTPNTRLTTTALLVVVAAVVAASAFFPTCHAFVPFRSLSRPSILVDVVVVFPTKGPMVASLWAALDNDTETTSSEKESSSSSPAPPTAKLTLEEKMKAWEATEEEVRAATLGGIIVPKGTNNHDDGSRSDAFDVGLYILFPFMVLSGLAFAFFPFIMGNLDLEGVGPPPTM